MRLQDKAMLALFEHLREIAPIKSLSGDQSRGWSVQFAENATDQQKADALALIQSRDWMQYASGKPVDDFEQMSVEAGVNLVMRNLLRIIEERPVAAKQKQNMRQWLRNHNAE